MADVARPLLATEGGGERASEQDGPSTGVRAWPTHKRLAVVGSLLLAGSGLLLASSRGPKASPFFAPTDLVSGWGDASCYTATGGTCRIHDCDAVRGAACGRGYCYCSRGCTGADGRCRPSVQSYELVASHTRLRNAKYDDQYVAAQMPGLVFAGEVFITSRKGQYMDLWNIYKLPGQDFRDNGTSYFVSPVEAPEYVAAPLGRGNDVQLQDLTSDYGLLDRGPFDIALVMSTLCRPHERPEAIQISGYREWAAGVTERQIWVVEWWNVVGWRWSWWRHQLGDRGHWIPEPPLNTSLPFC